MTDYDILTFLFILITTCYFLITEHLICKIERLEKRNKLLEEDNIDLRSGIYVKK